MYRRNLSFSWLSLTLILFVTDVVAADRKDRAALSSCIFENASDHDKWELRKWSDFAYGRSASNNSDIVVRIVSEKMALVCHPSGEIHSKNSDTYWKSSLAFLGKMARDRLMTSLQQQSEGRQKIVLN